MAILFASINIAVDFPRLVDGSTSISGFASIVAHLRKSHGAGYALDTHLTSQQHTDSTALVL
jgi:hypothetical protein